MAKAKGAPIEFDDCPEIKIAWGSDGRFTIKKKGITRLLGFVAPQNWLWQMQTPNLDPIGEPFANKREALHAAAKYFLKKS